MKLNRPILILALAVARWTNTDAQTYSLLVHDETIEYFFISLSKNLPHEIIKLNRDILEWNERDIYGEQDTLYQIGELTKGIMEIDTVRAFFTEQDLKYVEKQFQNLDGVRWYPEDFRRFDVIDSIGLNKIMSHSYSAKKMGKNYSYTFSIPLFSLDKQYAIVQQEFDCGYECSTYCIFIYKQSADKKSWDKITSWKCISAGASHE
ncbi:MAG: hypothetical protein JKY52_20410 [Flavobacteriales bacterium]|nr:hypothetical protein [Flavobacteriales bacterium]